MAVGKGVVSGGLLKGMNAEAVGVLEKRGVGVVVVGVRRLRSVAARAMTGGTGASEREREARARAGGGLLSCCARGRRG